ncbi:hypothetical protein Tco_0138050 [Tanacetum coccineum]
MDSILEDSVDEGNLADPNNDLVDTIPEMFTDEHTLDYSSPPLYDDVDDDLVELESDNDDSVVRLIYGGFYEVDALPSTNNEDKVFNPGILTHENLFEVTIHVTPEKNVNKTTNASLILEDFNPPLYELPFHKEVPVRKIYRFHLKTLRKTFSTPGFSLLKEFILLFSWNYLIGTLKLSKSLKFLKTRWRFFLALIERIFVFWMFCVSISIPYEQPNLGDGSS